MAVHVKTNTNKYAATVANITTEICQGAHCCSTVIGPMSKGATTIYKDSNLTHCMGWLLENEGNVQVTFSTDNTDGWLGDDMKLFFTNGITYHCPFGPSFILDYPDKPKVASNCSLCKYN